MVLLATGSMLLSGMEWISRCHSFLDSNCMCHGLCWVRAMALYRYSFFFYFSSHGPASYDDYRLYNRFNFLVGLLLSGAGVMIPLVIGQGGIIGPGHNLEP